MKNDATKIITSQVLSIKEEKKRNSSARRAEKNNNEDNKSDFNEMFQVKKYKFSSSFPNILFFANKKDVKEKLLWFKEFKENNEKGKFFQNKKISNKFLINKGHKLEEFVVLNLKAQEKCFQIDNIPPTFEEGGVDCKLIHLLNSSSTSIKLSIQFYINSLALSSIFMHR